MKSKRLPPASLAIVKSMMEKLEHAEKTVDRIDAMLEELRPDILLDKKHVSKN